MDGILIAVAPLQDMTNTGAAALSAGPSHFVQADLMNIFGKAEGPVGARLAFGAFYLVLFCLFRKDFHPPLFSGFSLFYNKREPEMERVGRGLAGEGQPIIHAYYGDAPPLKLLALAPLNSPSY